jgi:prepilin-type N-terminal cleavage/methylation domain-containing protein
MSHARRTGGFTLIELLVAITLASLVAVLGAVVLRAALDFHGRANRYLMEGEDLRAADRLLLREWSWRRGQDLVAGVNRLEFQTDRLSSVGDESAARIRYQCSENEAGQVRLERQLLARADAGSDRAVSGGARNSRAGSEGSGPTATGWRVLRTEVLVPQLVACSFGYLQTRESRDAKVAEWRGEVGAGQPVPRVVRLRLVTQRGEIAPLVYWAFGTDG